MFTFDYKLIDHATETCTLYCVIVLNDSTHEWLSAADMIVAASNEARELYGLEDKARRVVARELFGNESIPSSYVVGKVKISKETSSVNLDKNNGGFRMFESKDDVHYRIKFTNGIEPLNWAKVFRYKKVDKSCVFTADKAGMITPLTISPCGSQQGGGDDYHRDKHKYYKARLAQEKKKNSHDA